MSLSCSKKSKDSPESGFQALIPSETIPVGEQLLFAIEEGDTKKVKRILSEGFDVTHKNNQVDYLVQAVTSLKHDKITEYREIISALIDADCDVNALTSSQEPIINLAIEFGDLEVVRMLIQSRDFTPSEKHSPYLKIAQKRNVELLDLFIESQIEASDKVINNILFNTFIVEYRDDGFGEDAFHMPFTRSLLEKLNIDINTQEEGSGQTLLMKAARRNRVKAVGYFINEYKESIDINLQDSSGKTALLHAVQSSDQASSTLLLENCADKYIKDDKKNNVCEAACQTDEKEAKKSLRKIINSQYKDDNGQKCEYSKSKHTCLCILGTGAFLPSF